MAPSRVVTEHQTKADSSGMRTVFMPEATSPEGRIMLPSASPSSKSLAVVWRKALVLTAAAVSASRPTSTSAGARVGKRRGNLNLSIARRYYARKRRFACRGTIRPDNPT
jgi:hypothetical protein